MKCFKCGHETFETTTTDVTDLDNCLVVIRHVPCNECEFCGEVYYNGETVRQLEKITDMAKNISNEISVIDYKKHENVA